MMVWCRALMRLPWREMFGVLRVFVYGAQKHRHDMWCDHEFAYSYWEDKVDRHRVRWWMGQDNDWETGMPHHWHAIADMLMLAGNHRRRNGQDNRQELLQGRVYRGTNGLLQIWHQVRNESQEVGR